MTRVDARAVVARVVLGAVALAVGTSGCRPAPRGPRAASPAPPRIEPGAPSPGGLLDDVGRELVRAGASERVLVEGRIATDGERVGAFVTVPADLCLALLARGASSVEDLDLAILDDDGAVLAVDDGPEPTGALVLCPPHPARVYASALVVAGEGLVAVGAHTVTRAAAGGVAMVLGARAPSAPDARAERFAGLDGALRDRRTVIGAGFVEQRRVAAPVDRGVPAVATFSVGEDRCLDVVALADQDARAIELELEDEGGRFLTRSREAQGARHATVCASAASVVTASARSRGGRGAVAFVALEGAPGARPARGEVVYGRTPRDDAATSKALAGALAAAGYAPPVARERFDASVGRRHATQLVVPARGCTRLDALGGAGAGGLSLTLRGAGGERLVESEGAAGVTVFSCGARELRVDLEALDAPSPVRLEARAEPFAHELVTAHPRGSARALSALARRPLAPLDGAPAAADSVTAARGRDGTATVPLAAGHCLALGVGADDDVTGFVARVWDVADGTELDRASGTTHARLAACAAEGRPTSLRVEIEASPLVTTATFVVLARRAQAP